MFSIQKEKVCCFTGHRLLPQKEMPIIKKHLIEILDNLINKGVISYVCGGALGYDILAGSTVLELRKQYPNIKLIMALPCKDQCSKWTNAQKASYQQLLNDADEVIYLTEKYYDGCMLDRNRYMVERSGYCIAYLKSKCGGAWFTVNLANSQGLIIHNIFDKMQ